MKVLRSSIVVITVTSMVVGCGAHGLQAYKKYDLGPAESTIASAVESSGGLDAWRKVGQIRATALMTVYDRDGRAYVNRQKHDIDINSGRISVEATTARKAWRATYRRGGGFSLSGSQALDRMTPDELREVMAVLLHRLGGPMNLLYKDERPKDVDRLTLDGKDMVRVSVTGKQPHPVAYYFDATGGGLEMVSGGSEKPNQDGTVTIYTYQILPGGLVFPKKLSVVHTGDHVLVGRSKVMEVEYSDVQVN